MNFVEFGLYSAQEKQDFLNTRRAWRSLGRDDLESAITEQEEALKFQIWMNKVMPRRSYEGIRLHEDNIRFLKHIYATWF